MSSDNPYVTMMQAWIELASGNMQIAIGALILPIVFLRQVIGIPDGQSISSRLNKWLYTSWALLCLSILSWMFYQSIAICRVGQKLGNGSGCTCDIIEPELVFTFGSISLVVGIVLFAIGAVTAIKNESK